MSDRMKAAVMYEPGVIRIEEREIPGIGPNDVLVKIKHVGLCGSDIHYYEHGRIGDFVVEKPIVLGHECAGVITRAGENVKGLKEGDLVCLEPGVPCGACSLCMQGKYNLCPDVVFMATPPYDGAFTEYVAHPANLTFKLPEEIGTLEGALIEPLSVGFHAANQGRAKIGQSAAVLGAGCIGLVTMMTLRAMGIAQVYVSDIIAKRVEKAKELGALKAIKADETDVIDFIMNETNGEGVDMVFETAGSNITLQQTADLVKRGGTIVLVGMSPESFASYNFGKLISKEAEIKTVFRYRNVYPYAVKAVADGLIQLKGIVTDIYKFNDIEEAIRNNILNKQGVIKTVIEF